jgi:hypothetical protein
MDKNFGLPFTESSSPVKFDCFKLKHVICECWIRSVGKATDSEDVCR